MDLELLNFFTYGMGLGVMSWLMGIGFKFAFQALFGSEKSIENVIEWEKQG